MSSRSLFDAPQGVTPKTFFVPTLSANRRAQPLSRRRGAPPLAGCLDRGEHGGTPRASGRITHALRAVLRLAQRIVVAEALLLATIAICALAGLPAIVTAFFAALVEFLVSVWIAVRTLGPALGRLIRGRC